MSASSSDDSGRGGSSDDSMDGSGSGSAAAAAAAATAAAAAADAATAAVAAAVAAATDAAATATAAAAAAAATDPRGKKRPAAAPTAPHEDPSVYDYDSEDGPESGGDTTASDSGAASAAASSEKRRGTMSPKMKKRRVVSEILSTRRNGRGLGAKKMLSGAEMLAERRGCAVTLAFSVPLDKNNDVGRLTSRMVSSSLTRPGPGDTIVQESITMTLGPVLAAIAPEMALPNELRGINVGDIATVAMHMQACESLGSKIPHRTFYDAIKPKIPSDTLVPGGKRRRARNAPNASASYIDEHDLSDVDDADSTPRGIERRVLLPGTRRLLAQARASRAWFGGYPATGSIILDKKTNLFRFIVRVNDAIRVTLTAPTMAEAGELRRKYAAENDRLLNIWRVWPDDPSGNTIQMVIRMPEKKMTYVPADSDTASYVTVADQTTAEQENTAVNAKTLIFNSSYLDTVCSYVWTNWPSQQTHCTPTNPAGECRGKVSTDKRTAPLGIMKHMAGPTTRLANTRVSTDTSKYKVRDYRTSNWIESTDAQGGAASASP